MKVRHVAVYIAFEVLQDYLTVGWHENVKCVKGLPVGAKFVRSYTDGWRGIGVIVFEHSSFDEVDIGQELPVFSIEFQREYKNA